MLITRWIDYGSRIMILLGLNPEEWTSARELSSACEITRPAALRLIRQLAQAGLISTRRGPGGGVKLAKPASEVSFSDIMLATDKRRGVNPCLTGDFNCSRQNICAARQRLHPLQVTIDSFFEKLTLENLVEDQHIINNKLNQP
jgi:Rrf2 family protein